MELSPALLRISVRDVRCGMRVRIIEPSNIYECSLGDDCFVGPFVEIQKGVEIGERTKVQSHSFVCEMVVIGNDCFIGHGVKFVNDVFSGGGPAHGNKALWRSTRIGDRVYRQSEPAFEAGQLLLVDPHVRGGT